MLSARRRSGRRSSKRNKAQVEVQPHSPSGRPRRLTLLMRNGKGGRSPVSWRDLPLFGDSCARPELPRRDADEALEVAGELALVREAGAGGQLRQEAVTVSLLELLRPLDAAGENVLVRAAARWPP